MTAPHHKLKGFTLIELLIVIALIAIIASVAFVALNPLERFRDARDSARWADVSAILSAIKIDQVDNGGSYIGAITTTTAAQVYMIASINTGCDDENGSCDDNVNSDTNCVDLTGLVTEGYLASVPVSPLGSSSAWAGTITGYILIRSSTGVLGVQACESEGGEDVKVER